MQNGIMGAYLKSWHSVLRVWGVVVDYEPQADLMELCG